MRHLVVFVGMLAAACGGSTASIDGDGPDGGTQDGGSTLDATGFDGGQNDGSPGGGCPSATPANGALCSVPRLSCEYGGVGEHLLCSTIAECVPTSSGVYAWLVGAPAADCISSPANNPLGCPPSFATLPNGAACPREAVSQCVYDQGVCGCGPCAADGGAPAQQWTCVAWPTPNGCPAARPRIGTPCAPEGKSCLYGTMCQVNDGEPSLLCKNGVWTVEPIEALCALPRCGK
jgi:hypothetical protein